MLAAVWLVATGFCDLDWMIVSYRYSEWHRTQQLWEFCPFLKVNWWTAYMLSICRVVAGCLILGYLARAREGANP